ncbi:YlqD family protein [Virgibacillus alimentarius]|uniref:YlqD protein n=1 Tax=Virgibacillus alimentarius TaxID=698769 RepID=A0ABS4S5I9_9BACI|nr:MULTISPECIES: YlqD family protein [Virgibacillus]MBP2256174.1 hypothetical protein [Virgibacillus alimentarius]HLR66121.1 YlqD family protein [Virgibacillus sp.]
MQIIKKVQIKQILTEKSKAELHTKFLKSKMRLEQECQQLLFEQKKLKNKTGIPNIEIDKRFQQEVANRKEKIKLVDFKIEQLDTLELGNEIIEGEVEALVEVKEGSHWDDIMGEQAIVIKDQTVIRIEK